MNVFKITLSVLVSLASPPTFSNSSTWATSEIARPSLTLPPPQPNEHEENKDEDFYDDLFPLNE